MKHTIFLLLSAILVQAQVLIAQTQHKLNLKHATVFLNGALLENTITLNLEKGDNEISFTNLATTVNSQSIIINATNGVAVASSTFSGNYQPGEQSILVLKLQDSIALLIERKIPVNIKISVIDDQLKLLETDISETGNDKPAPSTLEIEKMIDLIGRKKETLMLAREKQVELKQQIDLRIALFNKKIDEEVKKNVGQGGLLLVKFYAREATTSNITVKYAATNAGWSPTYDIWADDVKSPVKLYYKANIYQNTGIKWDNVRITLSTGNPQEGMQPPAIIPWFLSLNAPTVSREVIVQQNNTQNMRYSATTSTADLVALTPGIYQSKRGSDLSSDGARTSGNIYIVDGVQVQQAATMNSYVAIDNSGVNTSFEIEVPYTIPNDGQQHFVAIKEYLVPATYKYYSVPKMDKDAFLQAEITSWNDLNLLPGITNIFYEGTYIGQGTIDPRTIKDTMYLSLGRDKKVVVKRELDKKMHSLKRTASNEQQIFAYNITVRNTRKETMTILINDQLPVSNDKNIVIEDVEIGDADREEGSGIIAWRLTLKPNESKKVSFGYTIKHPRARQLIGMK